MKVEFFDSFEQAAQRLQQAMEAADAKVRPWLAAIAPGDCFVLVDEASELVIFGQVLETYAETRLRHYRFCRCFSVACPEGELGDVHVSAIDQVISRAEFEAARADGWDPGGTAPGTAPRTAAGSRRI